MVSIPADEPRAIAAFEAIHAGRRRTRAVARRRPRAREVAAGADASAPFGGSHAETPLHWAASSDDVGVLDALVAAGADVEAPGSVIDGGSPLSDAVAFGQWRAASRLLEHRSTGQPLAGSRPRARRSPGASAG
jgi:ankyrin repeat protein